jgi:TrpR-related protein YerC/YecD
MQTSSKKLSRKQQQKITRQFVTLLSDLRHLDECQTFFESFLTKTEQSVFAKRLGIVWMLDQNKSYEEIKKKLKVSSATISSVARQMNEEGSQLMVGKLRVDDWAGRWAQKIISWLSLR